MNQGRCLCGKVRYEVDGEFVAVVNCHCSMCRKHHGAPFVTWAVAPAAAYKVTAGADSIARHESSAGVHRSFCRTCGSVIPERTPDRGAMSSCLPAISKATCRARSCTCS